MKEAAGEANMTVITIILIAIVAAVATPLITNLMSTSKNKTCCLNAGGTWAGNACGAGTSSYYDAATYAQCIAAK